MPNMHVRNMPKAIDNQIASTLLIFFLLGTSDRDNATGSRCLLWPKDLTVDMLFYFILQAFLSVLKLTFTWVYSVTGRYFVQHSGALLRADGMCN